MKPRDNAASRIRAAAALAALLCLALPARGQETVRMSLAGAEAARARRLAASTPGYYNLQVGPTWWRFGSGLGVECTSNVNLQETNPQGDVIFRPQIDTHLLWPISDAHSLNLSVGLGYSAYVNNPDLDRLFVTPGTELSFDFYVGDFWINVHDRFSVTEDASQNPTLAGTGDYAQLQNAAGVGVVWDLNKVVVRAGYDHVLYQSLGNTVSQQDGHSELFFTSAGYNLQAGQQVGLELGAGLVHYNNTNSGFSDANQWNAGAYLDQQISEYMHFRGSAGYTVYTPEPAGLPSGTTFSGVYADLEFDHRLDQFVYYTLSGGRNINFAFYGESVDLYFARLQLNWKFFRQVTLATILDY